MCAIARLVLCDLRVCLLRERRGSEAIWYTQQTIRSSSFSETTESEQVCIEEESRRAFPPSLIRESGSEEEEVWGRGDKGRRVRKPGTESIGGLRAEMEGNASPGTILWWGTSASFLLCLELFGFWGRRKLVKAAHLRSFSGLHFCFWCINPPLFPLVQSLVIRWLVGAVGYSPMPTLDPPASCTQQASYPPKEGRRSNAKPQTVIFCSCWEKHREIWENLRWGGNDKRLGGWLHRVWPGSSVTCVVECLLAQRRCWGEAVYVKILFSAQSCTAVV